MDGLYSAISRAAAVATDLATGAASAASKTAAQATASTPTAMESIIQRWSSFRSRSFIW